MTLIQEISKLIPRGLLSETAGSGISAEVHDKLVGRFERGFSIDQIHSMMRHKHFPGNQQVTPAEEEEIFDEILSNKDAVIKRALTYLKDDEISALVQLTYYARKHGYDYPEFKAIEKSMGMKEGSSQRAFAAGYRDDANVQFINRRKGKKIVQHIIVKEEKLTFTSHDVHVDSDGDIWVHMMSNHPDDDYYDDYKGINVIFKPDGKIEHITHENKAEDEWKKYKKEIMQGALEHLHIGDKEFLLKYLLTLHKGGHYHDEVKALIAISRHHGFDYPEFKAIEKSAAAT
jgi:hypothetical protein